MPSYSAQDFQCDLPPVVEDRSTNILTLSDSKTGLPYQLIANRDQLLGTETLAECLARQLKLLARQTKDFKYTQFTAPGNMPGQAAINCIQSEFLQGGKKVYQLQAMLALATPKLLILTFSSTTAITETMRATWNQMMGSLKV